MEDRSSYLTDLELLQLADSALPIGSLAHSFGLETLVSEGLLVVGELESFLRSWLVEAGVMEAVFCREAYRIGTAGGLSTDRWVKLNFLLSARKAARESRTGSVILGRNFLLTVAALTGLPALNDLLATTRKSAELHRTATHYCLAFGLVAGLLGFDEQRTMLTYLHQSVASMVSGCQRLLPLGQTDAARILWNLKSLIVEAAGQSTAYSCDDVCSFVPLLDWGAMEHPALSTRLFIS
jgi:urease accessory protein